MPGAELTGAQVGAAERSLCGWGGVRRARCNVVRVQRAQDVAEAVSGGGTGLGYGYGYGSGGMIARGAGRSYGDAAQLAGGLVLDMTGLQRIVEIDAERQTVRAQAGARLAALLARLGQEGMTLPVLPGTRHVTLGGAIAADVHGKNHHCDGALARHVLELTLCTPTGDLLTVSPGQDPDLFYATLGGMGLTGIVVSATLRAEPLAAPWVQADVERTDGLHETLAAMSAGEPRRYSVAWLDLLADGPRMGRALITRADPLDELPGVRRRASSYGASLQRGPALEVPHGFPAALLRPSSMRTFNALRWRAAPRRERGRAVPMASFFFPLDGLGEWSRLYGPRGLVQYQFAIPDGCEAELERCFAIVRERRLPVYLAVFKRFGAEFGGPLSFPLAGWTLAIDLPAGAEGLEPALQELDEIVAGAGGRVYLAKDVRMAPETLRAMYPRLDEFMAVRERVDPHGSLRSDLGDRLGLSGVGLRGVAPGRAGA